jgi:hypothetical protein
MHENLRLAIKPFFRSRRRKQCRDERCAPTIQILSVSLLIY